MPAKPLLAAVATLIILSGCVPLIIAGGAGVAGVAAQERSPGNTVDDNDILVKLKAKYAQQDYKNLLFNILIKVNEGRVLLTGNVDNADAQIQAVQLAWQVDGVKEVINEIQVDDKSGFSNYARDVWISTQVRSRLIFTKDIHSLNYSVVTVNQTVYLIGIAQDQAELDRATYVASTTSYVQKVVSYVRMKDDPKRGQ